MPSETLKRSHSPELQSEKANKRPNISSRSNSIKHQHESGTSTAHNDPSSITAINSTSAPSQASEITSKNTMSEEPATTTAAGSSALPQGESQTNAQSSSSNAPPGVPSQNIHMRCLIVTTDASVIIGRNGSHVNEIREKSGARVMVSESIPGNPERILNVSGALDAVSKARLYPSFPHFSPHATKKSLLLVRTGAETHSVGMGHFSS